MTTLHFAFVHREFHQKKFTLSDTNAVLVGGVGARRARAAVPSQIINMKLINTVESVMKFGEWNLSEGTGVVSVLRAFFFPLLFKI